MKRRVFYIDDGEQWWISACSAEQALNYIRDMSGYPTIEAYKEDHEIRCQELPSDTKIRVDHGYTVEEKTAEEWAAEEVGIITST